MPEDESPKKKDIWDVADVIGKLLIPIAIAAATLWFDSSRKESEAKQKTLEVALEILKAPKSAETEQLRGWALKVFQEVTGNASAGLPPGAIQELQQGTQLPSTSQLQLPNPGQLRVFIMRLEGTSAEQSERIRSELIAAGYTNVTLAERPQSLFPDRAEVRFYYPADSQNAQSLSDYITQTLRIPTQVNDRSQDRDTSNHRPGDLHIYLK